MKTEEILEYILNNSEFKAELVSDLPVENILLVDALEIDSLAKFLVNENDLFFDSLMNLSGVDEDKENLSVYYHLYSMKHKHKLTLKTVVSKENPFVNTVCNVWRTADWHEREAYDLVGITFNNHPDLRRILMPEDWEEGSHPLRKDYESPEFYQGMKIKY